MRELVYDETRVKHSENMLHVDTLYNSADMQQLTFSYENAMYQKDKPQQNGKIRTLMGSAYEKLLLRLNQMTSIQRFNIDNVNVNKMPQRTK